MFAFAGIYSYSTSSAAGLVHSDGKSAALAARHVTIFCANAFISASLSGKRAIAQSLMILPLS